MRRTTPLAAVPAIAVLSAALVSTGQTRPAHAADNGGALNRFKHIVVIYEENHSFDNLYGGWGPVGGKTVEGQAQADPAHTAQVTEEGAPYPCLPQNDVNLTDKGTLPAMCVAASGGKTPAAPDGKFANAPFNIDQYIPASATTCPTPGAFAAHGVRDGSGLAGGCTEDLVHRFYQEQYQLDGGKQDRYVTGSDAVGLAMGSYDTKALPIYKYLHSAGAPNYVVADHFFQAAFGGSFLNHQYLVAARPPTDTSAGPGGANADKHSVVDANGFPKADYPLYAPVPPGTAVADKQLTQACGTDGKGANPKVACGNFGVNTMQPSSIPAAASGAKLPLIDDDVYPNIGDRLSAANVDWNWYSGGWDDAAAGHAGPLFQYHHQPLNYFKNFAVGGKYRSHLQDEKNFLSAAAGGTLPAVSFVKPYGAENEHPGYASEPNGSDHLVDLVKAISSGPQGKDTLIVVTYDEFGGQWDHVPPPGQGNSTAGPSDAFGPGTRVPTLLIGPKLEASTVDHTVYDTTSILATIEHRFRLQPLATRDAAVSDLGPAVRSAEATSVLGERVVASLPAGDGTAAAGSTQAVSAQAVTAQAGPVQAVTAQAVTAQAVSGTPQFTG